jgi:RNA:NAD 2'-phosphotransferase (TPT1/KptA family)
MATLYHGTTRENAEQIKASGAIYAPVYLSATPDHAAEYALSNDPDGVVIAVEYTGELFADNESSEWANADEAINNGAEVYSTVDVDVSNARYTEYEDYEAVNA